MVEYTKPWLSINQQVDRLADRGLDVGNRDYAAKVLRAIGYYRLTGYLYPFRLSEEFEDEEGEIHTRILSTYQPGTSIVHAVSVVDFDRRLRMSVLDGVERVEVALRMQVGYTLGRISPFAHLQESTFVKAFTDQFIDAQTGTTTSHYRNWYNAMDSRRSSSDEAFVAHFRDKYDDQMPIWALTEILEMGNLAKMYRGLTNDLATEIAVEFGAPSKKVMASWLASINYVRNVAAHHARLYNRKLVAAPGRPRVGTVPLLDHLRDGTTPKDIFGTYNTLAVIAYFLRSIDSNSGWTERIKELIATFPSTPTFSIRALGFPINWEDLELWRGR